jgi:predicted DNA-binding protein YlxM (UPF0122 family)
MRTYEEYHKILSLWDTGLYNKSEIADKTGVPRLTVSDCIKKFGSLKGLEENLTRKIIMDGECYLVKMLKDKSDPEKIHSSYAYMLGIYLGDGYISKGSERVLKIRITLDVKYPKIIEHCVKELQKLLPDNRVNVVDKYDTKNGERYISCVEVVCHYKYWHQVFPQHAKGRKHNRSIILEDWQQYIVDKYPLEFFRGLYHSDGSRSRNFINGKDYPRYFFANWSDDILKLYTDTVDRLGLIWTTTNRRNVAISRREDVAWLDRYVGAKA